MNGGKELRLTHVRPGWRVKHFRPRRNGEFVCGTVYEVSDNRWCIVKWDGRPKGMVMIDCLIATGLPTPPELKSTPAREK